MRSTHNRKWPIYTMPVGGRVTVENPPKSLRFNLYRRAALHGMVVSIRRFNGQDPLSGFVVTRRA
jgi:hypothetical protein